MRKLIQHFIWTAALLLTVSSARGFVLYGPIGNGGDNWQVPTIGYGLGGDLAAPKNIGEEYRRVTPVMYYAYDANFFGFFGLAGATNIDIAFSTMNTLTNVSNYSFDLSEFPLESQQYNYTAQSLGLIDLKSVTFALLAEQMGLGEPERYIWTLHDRYQPPSTTCPNSTTYLVVQRNFDTINSLLNQVQYSPYVNGTLFTYQIFENCTGPNPLAGTVPINADPFASVYTPVADFSLDTGGYYTTFTRDDVAGLRYMLSSNNVNYEATAPSGGLLLTTNAQSPLTLTTLPLSLLFAQSLTNDPTTLSNLYPGITFLSVQTNIVNQVTTNRLAYFTNLAGPYTNRVPLSNGVAVYATNGIVPFTNWSPVQYGNPPQLLTTLSLGQLLFLSQFTDPFTLQAIYPGLVIDQVITNYLGVQINTNIFPYYTNLSFPPIFSTYIPGGLTNGTYFTNQPGPTVINYDTHSFLTITTLDLAVFAETIRTNDPVTVSALYPGIQIADYQADPTILYETNYVYYLTNSVGSPYQGNPISKKVATSTNAYFGTLYTYTFGNVFTNHFYTNRLVRTENIWITNVIGAPYPSFTTITNYTYFTNRSISGDFFIIPTNWCGFKVLSSINPKVNPNYTFGPTNTVVYSGYSTNGSVGTNYVIGGNAFGLIQNTADIFTNFQITIRPGICEPVLTFGTNFATNVVSKFEYSFLNVITNHYYTNSLVWLYETNIYAIPGGSPNLLGTNVTVKTYYTNFPSGDFYLVPTNWCGYQILGLLTNLIAPTNIVFGTNFTGTTNLQYTFVQYQTYTNYTYSIRPGFCEPALAFDTNFSTNIVAQYKYYFGSIITNRYYTNSFATVVTTNLAVLTNGLAGLLTNIVTTNSINLGVGGDFFIAPPAWCGYSILATQLNTIVLTTNQFTATNLATPDLGERYTETTVSRFTNTTFLIQPTICTTVTPPPALRQGIERIQFVRANYDSLIGQFFQPFTNYYTMTVITNGQRQTEYYQRVITRPDFLMSAQDLNGGPATIPVNPYVARNLNFDQSTILNGLAGPGTITPSTTFTFNKAGRTYYNVSPAFVAPAFISATNSRDLYLWGSFDGSTNDPVVYPNGTSIADLQNQIVLQVTPSILADGTNGTPYPAVLFSASGAQPPYSWSASNVAAQVPGMTVTGAPASATLSGTPTAAGVFNLTIQVTDSVNRVVSRNYTITIH